MGGCSSSESGPGSPAYGFDFGSEPLSSETEVWAEGKEVLAKAPTHLRSMTEYKGCDALIRNVRIDLFDPGIGGLKGVLTSWEGAQFVPFSPEL